MLELKRSNSVEKEAVKRYRQVVDGRQIRLARRAFEERKCRISFSIFARVSRDAEECQSVSRDRLHPLPRRRMLMQEKRRKRRKKQATCSDKIVVTPSACQSLVTRKQRDTPFHKGRPSSINNVGGSQHGLAVRYRLARKYRLLPSAWPGSSRCCHVRCKVNFIAHAYIISR